MLNPVAVDIDSLVSELLQTCDANGY